MQLNFIVLKDNYVVCRFKNDADIPQWVERSDFYSETRTSDELSIVCKQSDSVTNDCVAKTGWRISKIQGFLDFSLIGIIAEISGIFKENNISVFTVSTYNTDYFLIQDQHLGRAIEALEVNNHQITYENNENVG
jgi:uncharacterized protein